MMSRSNTTYDMSQSVSGTRTVLTSLNNDLTRGLATIALIAACSVLSLYRLQPPAVDSSSASQNEFSARALAHLEIIAQGPHQIGSPQHSKVRDYITMQLTAGGLTPELQRTTVVVPASGSDFKAASVENIVARLNGTANSKAVLLMAHYDSVPTSFGANDNGSGVIALLETLRALSSEPPLKNDVIFLFTDAEEVGSLGAQAFVQEHPWAKDVGLVLNFDARGNGGPSLMFETSDRNSWLIKEFAKAVPHPVANSLSSEIYRRMPNDTDLTIFKRAGIAGLNFAYIDGTTRYHTVLDNKDQIGERSFQHHFSNALALTRHFGNIDLQNSSSGNDIYFDLLRISLLHYPAALALPIASIVAVLFVGLVVIGFKRGRLTLAGLALGFLTFLLSLILVPAIMSLAGLSLRLVPGANYQSGLFFGGFVAITVAIVVLIEARCRKRISLENLTAGALSWWLILLILASFFLPGGSYLLAWPLLFALPALAYTLLAKDGLAFSWKLVLPLWLAAIVAVVLLVPAIRQVFSGLGFSSIGLVLTGVVLLLGLLRPHLKLMTLNREWLLPTAAGLIGVSLLAAGWFTSGFNAAQPKPDTLFYGLNADTGQAVWASSDRNEDRWTSLVLPADTQRKPLPEFFPLNASRTFRQSSAPAGQLASPQVELLENRANDSSRVMRLRVTSSRQAPVMSIYLETTTDVQSISVNGKRLEDITRAGRVQSANQWSMQYFNVPVEGVELAFDLRTEGQVKLRVVDQTYGLPELEGKSIESRPSGLMPARDPLNDSTFVSKSFTF